jgi:hypothetical protein
VIVAVVCSPSSRETPSALAEPPETERHLRHPRHACGELSGPLSASSRSETSCSPGSPHRRPDATAAIDAVSPDKGRLSCVRRGEPGSVRLAPAYLVKLGVIANSAEHAD